MKVVRAGRMPLSTSRKVVIALGKMVPFWDQVVGNESVRLERNSVADDNQAHKHREGDVREESHRHHLK